MAVLSGSMSHAPPRDSEGGQFVSTFSDEDLIELLTTDGPLLTNDVVSEFGCTQRNARYRLNAFVDEGIATVEWIGPTKRYHLSSGESA